MLIRSFVVTVTNEWGSEPFVCFGSATVVKVGQDLKMKMATLDLLLSLETILTI